MFDRIANMARRIFGRTLVEKFSERWVSSTVTVGEASAGRHSQPPGKTFTGRATQYVLICALMNARVCSSQRLRLYVPSKNGAKSRRVLDRTVKGRKRIDYLTRRVNGPGLKAAEYAEYAADIQEVTEHPAMDLIHKPNPWQTGTEFTEQAYCFMELAGNAYVNTYFDEAVPEMYMLGPQYVTIIPSDTEFVRGYYYQRDQSDPYVFAPDDVMHFKFAASPLSPYYGVGPLQAVLLEADLASAATQAEVYRWLNGGRPDFVVEIDPATTPDQRDQIKAEIVRETRGVKKSGRFLTLQNSKVVPLGFRPKDMEYVAGLARSDELIWNAFGIPQSELKMNDANYASASTGNVQYLSRTIAPRCNRFAEYLTEYLLPKFGVEPGAMWFAYDEIVPEDELKEAEMDRLDVGAGILTLNEARANRGLDPYEEAIGDMPRINGTSVERLDAPPVPAQFPPASNQEINVEAPEGTDEDAVAEKVLAGLLPHVKGDGNGNAGSNRDQGEHGAGDVGTGRVGSGGAYSNGDTRHGDGCAREADHEVRYDLSSNIACLKFYGSILSHKEPVIAGAPRGTVTQLDGFAARLDEWYRNAVRSALAGGQAGVVEVPAGDLQKIIDEELRNLFHFAARAGAREAGKPGEYEEVLPRSALDYLNTYTVRLAREIPDDLASSLNDAIRSGLTAGDTYDQITTRINIEMPEIARWRAERVARTETSYAMTEGRRLAWGDLDIKEKQWLLSGNPCEFCEAVALQYAGPIPMNQPFYRVGETIVGTEGGTYLVTWRDVQGPPLHPNDACGLIPVL